MKKILIIACAVIALIQWLVPMNMVWSHENILRKGKAFKFQTEPVDPVNPFKGRYVSLNFIDDHYQVNDLDGLKGDEPIFVKIRTNDSGFAKITGLVQKEPADTENYFTAKIRWVDHDSKQVYLIYPFEEYYMEESKAPEAERIYRDSALARQQVYALVKIYRGNAVLDGLFINGKPIEELIK